MRSPAMVAVSGALLVLVVLASFATADITIEETVLNSCTSAVNMQCKTTAGKDYGLQALLPSAQSLMEVTSTLFDSDLTCTFSSTGLAVLATQRACKIWEYLKMGFTDSPEMSCSAGCFWKTQDDGLYYRTAGGDYLLFALWTALPPGIVV